MDSNPARPDTETARITAAPVPAWLNPDLLPSRHTVNDIAVLLDDVRILNGKVTAACDRARTAFVAVPQPDDVPGGIWQVVRDCSGLSLLFAELDEMQDTINRTMETR